MLLGSVIMIIILGSATIMQRSPALNSEDEILENKLEIEADEE